MYIIQFPLPSPPSPRPPPPPLRTHSAPVGTRLKQIILFTRLLTGGGGGEGGGRGGEERSRGGVRGRGRGERGLTHPAGCLIMRSCNRILLLLLNEDVRLLNRLKPGQRRGRAGGHKFTGRHARTSRRIPHSSMQTHKHKHDTTDDISTVHPP